jgi:predicted nucleic acid-binding protein
MSTEDLELQRRLKEERKRGQFQDYHLEMEDLLAVELLERRRNLGKGELSSIAFARRTRQAFLTDDQKARRLAEQVMEMRMVQTTPYLFGWLFYVGVLVDQDKDEIIEEHESLEKRIPLTAFFEAIYMKSLEYKLLARGIEVDH